MFTTTKCHSSIKKTCSLGRFTHVERSDRSALGMLDNLLSTSVNLKQVAKPFAHRCFDDLTTFCKKNLYSKSSLLRDFNSLKRDSDSLKREFSHHITDLVSFMYFSFYLHHNSLKMKEIMV